VNLSKAGYKGDQVKTMQARIVEKLKALPGVESASYAGLAPLSGGGWNGAVQVEGYTPKPDENVEAHFNAIGPGHFRTLRTPMLLGREFNERDTAKSPKVVIINEAFVRRYFGGSSPLGKHVNQAEVVGVVKDMKYRSIRQEFPPTAFWAYTQSGPPWGSYYVRGPLATPVAVAVREIDRNLKIGEVRTLEQHVDNTIVRERLLALLAGFFGVLALIVSCLGIYGVTAFQVTRRTNEIGVRMALGARGSHVAWTVLREILALVTLGVAIAIPLALWLSALAKDLLFGVKPADPATYLAAASLLGIVALAAGAIPAIRATRVDPMSALRYE
jgi:putative ABC transport system permease protein